MKNRGSEEMCGEEAFSRCAKQPMHRNDEKECARTAKEGGEGRGSAFARYSFTARLLCTKQPSFHPRRPPALPTLVQYYCTVGQYTTPHPDCCLSAIHHTILVITISCKGQGVVSIERVRMRGA